MEINSDTNELFVVDQNSFAFDRKMLILDGQTCTFKEFFDYPSDANRAFALAVNDRHNKVYVLFILVPHQGEPAIFILDRDTGDHTFVGESDLEPLAFNKRSNRLFAGVQVGTRGAIVHGATDRIFRVNLPGGGTSGGIGAIAARASTDHAYMVSPQFTFVVKGSTRRVQRIRSGLPPGGDFQSVAINQATGRVYVVNDDEAERVVVIQDR
jgi:DNA-binding beta-propeller fold protein YncE